MQAKILFSHESKISENEHLKNYVNHHPKSFSMMVVDEELLIIIKTIEERLQTEEKVRMIAGSIVKLLNKQKIEDVFIHESSMQTGFPALSFSSVVTAFVEGFHLGQYQFLPYKSTKKEFTTNLHITSKNKEIKHWMEIGYERAQATAFSRNLMNEVPNVLHPETFPQVLKDKFAETGVEVHIYDEQQLSEMEMNGILAVGRGSKYKPRLVELIYQTDETKPLVTLVGKGVTFDTGGISLKRGRDLSDMRMDMGGAAAVAGTMALLSALQANVNVVALIPIVENMPDSESLLPGEVIRYKTGQTVQVGNTDAEGRLILADGLIRAQEMEPDYILNIATLTGAVQQALGSKVAGVFGDEKLAFLLKELGDRNGDNVWPLPLVDDYDSYLKSNYADFSNISSKGEAGAITAGLFLRRFIKDADQWLHIDMAGVMESKDAGYYTNEGSGFGTRLLADFTMHVSKD